VIQLAYSKSVAVLLQLVNRNHNVSEIKSFIELADYLFLIKIFGNKMRQTWSKQLEKEEYIRLSLSEHFHL